MIDLSAAVAAFLVEGRELTVTLEEGLLRLESGHDRGDHELINALFRAAHTLKGSAGIVGLEGVGQFMHRVETLLDHVRAGTDQLDDARLGVLLRCCDHLNQLLDRAEAGDHAGAALAPAGEALLAQLQGPGGGAAEAAPAPRAGTAAAGAASGLRVFAVFGTDCLRHGMDPASALLYLDGRLAPGARVLLASRVPVLDALDPESCHLALALHAPQGDAAAVREAFEFFDEDSLITVVEDGLAAASVRERLAGVAAALGQTPPAPWCAAGLLEAAEWPGAAAPSPAAVEAPPPAPAAVAPAAPAVPATPPAAATAPAGAAAAAAAPAARHVRVPAERLDELIVQVGELVIAGASVEVLARETRNTRLQEAVGGLMQLIDTIQSGTLQLRMVPIGETFSRFQRVVRDVSRELGKQIQLDIVGGETELDKSMVERIGDPLMHMVRNAMDHGLEPPAERLAAGKPETGTLRLRAYHDSGNVIVEVSDDGRGLDRARIVAKAVERGLIASGEGLSDAEVHQLVFEPGFSTAAQVTSLSGRGVGMDVVKRSVEALRGAITLTSRPGMGTLTQMRLPLTLAIIDGFMVGVGAARFILPLDQVVECIELPAGATDGERPQYLDLRGEVLPYVCLRRTFGIDGEPPRRPSVVVVRSGDLKAGVLVDTLHGEIQTVIKPMTGIFRHLRGISGTSILGTGDIALILDLLQLVQSTVERGTRAPQPA